MITSTPTYFLIFFTLSVMMQPTSLLLLFFFFNDTATTEIYTLSLHDALPIFKTARRRRRSSRRIARHHFGKDFQVMASNSAARSEEHTSELQSPDHLVCRLLLEKKKNNIEKYASDTRWSLVAGLKELQIRTHDYFHTDLFSHLFHFVCYDAAHLSLASLFFF